MAGYTEDAEKDAAAGKNNTDREPLIIHTAGGGGGEVVSTNCGAADDYQLVGGGGGGDVSVWMVVLSTAVSVCGSFEFGTCVGYTAPTQSGIIGEIGLSVSQFSLFGSLITVGAMVGAATSGPVADLIGRKRAMRLSAATCLIGWITIYFGHSALLLYIGRIIGGYGIGVISYVVPIYIAEIAPKNMRGELATMNQLFNCGGLSSMYIVGAFVSWRKLTLLGMVPCLVLLIGLFFIPESPRWLAKFGRANEEEALQRLRGKNADISQELREIQEHIDELNSEPRAHLDELMDPKYSHTVMVGIGLMVFQQAVGVNGIGFYASEIFVASGFSSGYLGTILIGCTQVPVTIVGAELIDKIGRRPLLMVSAIGTFFGCVLAGVAFLLKAMGALLDLVPILTLTGILVYSCAFSIGLGPVPWVIMSEIFPIHIKGIAGSLVTLINWLCSWAITYTFNFLMRWSQSGTMFIFAAAAATSVLFVAREVPETNGKTLEEIQALLH